MTKRCRLCKIHLPLASFGVLRTAPDGLRQECRQCRNAAGRAIPKGDPRKERTNARLRARPKDDPHRILENAKALARYHANPGPANERNLRRKYAKKYGITPEDKQRILAEQGGVCAICKTSNWTKSGPSVDHCHKSGVVRGILCNRRNAGIGYLGDDPVILNSAIEYINLHISLLTGPTGSLRTLVKG